MISSHDIELVAASGAVNDNYHLIVVMLTGEIVFDYQIKQGGGSNEECGQYIKKPPFSFRNHPNFSRINKAI